MEQLMKNITEANEAYYNSAESTMSDAAYDAAKRKLMEMAEENPEQAAELGVWDLLNAVGAAPVTDVVKHAFPMWSLSNSRNDDEFRKWYPNGEEVAISDKEDGSGISLEYQGGKLISGATRGDGKVGENITSSVHQLASVPKSIPYHGKVQITGEVTLPLSQFEKAKELDGYEYKNTRNAANGIIRRDRENDASKKLLQFHAYNVNFEEEPAMMADTYDELMTSLEQWGFITVAPTVFSDVESAMLDIKRRERERPEKSILVDGAVVRVNSLKAFKEAGYTSKAPKGATAYKFETIKAEVVIESIFWSVGKKGKISPNAMYAPTDLGGVTNDRCLAHTFAQMQKKGLKIGCTAVIEKCGDVIPQVLSVRTDLFNGTEQDIVEPTTCPLCDHPVAHRGDYIYCVNDSCDRVGRSKLLTFVNSIDFKGIGPKAAEKLALNGSFKNPSDFFQITEDDLVAAGVAGKNAMKIVKQIEECKSSITQKQIFQGLSIDYCGEGTSDDLIVQAGLDIRDMLHKSQQWFENIPNVGPIKAASLAKWFSDPANIAEIRLLDGLGVFDNQSQDPVVSGDSLQGEFICITGTLSVDKKEYYAKIQAAGGDYTESFKKSITKMVVGDKAGSKEAKARAAGITVWTEQDLINALK